MDASTLHASSSDPSNTADELTGHENSQLPSPSVEPAPASQPFSFPTLNIDGSLGDLPSRQYHQTREPPTPPAALSSLGVKARMGQHGELEGFFADSQYDMVDDLSEISTDDHDTASIISNDEPGRATPEEGSDIDDDDNHEEVTPHYLQTPSTTEASFVDVSAASTFRTEPQQLKAENALLDSYTSEDLETPRQSTSRAAFSSTYMRATSKSKISSALQPDDATKHILLVSGRDVAQAELDFICAKVADCMRSMAPSFAGDVPSKVVRLPVTPSGISLPSATVVCGDDRIAATIQHCIGAEERSGNSFKLRILDSDGEHSSFYITSDSRDAKISFTKPDMAVFFLNAAVNKADWLDIAFRAVQQLNVPTLVVRDNCARPRTQSFGKQLRDRDTRTKQTIDHLDLIDMQSIELSDVVLGLLGRRPPQCLPLSSRLSVSRRKFDVYDVDLVKVLFAALVAVLPLLLLTLMPTTTPAMALAVRREALSMAVGQAVNSSDAAKTVNIEHLLPALTGPCATTDFFGRVSPDCIPNVPFQGIAPNHIILSLPVKPRAPQLASTKVYRADGKLLAFNQSKLIDGVYHITLDADEAYGTVIVNMQTTRPDINVTLPHYFGSRILQRKTYGQASTDVGKAVVRDVTVMRGVAKSLTEKLTTELGATIWATKNVTTQLALYVARDFQAVGNTAVTVFGKAAKAGNKTALAITKDFVLLQRDLTKFTKDLTTTVNGGMQSAKARLRTRTELSRERLRGIKHALERRQKDGSIGSNLSKLSDRIRGVKKPVNGKSCTKGRRSPKKTDKALCSHGLEKRKFKKALEERHQELKKRNGEMKRELATQKQEYQQKLRAVRDRVPPA